MNFTKKLSAVQINIGGSSCKYSTTEKGFIDCVHLANGDLAVIFLDTSTSYPKAFICDTSDGNDIVSEVIVQSSVATGYGLQAELTNDNRVVVSHSLVGTQTRISVLLASDLSVDDSRFNNAASVNYYYGYTVGLDDGNLNLQRNWPGAAEPYYHILSGTDLSDVAVGGDETNNAMGHPVALSGSGKFLSLYGVAAGYQPKIRGFENDGTVWNWVDGEPRVNLYTVNQNTSLFWTKEHRLFSLGSGSFGIIFHDSSSKARAKFFLDGGDYGYPTTDGTIHDLGTCNAYYLHGAAFSDGSGLLAFADGSGIPKGQLFKLCFIEL